MTTKEKLKELIDQIPEKKVNIIEPFLNNLLKDNILFPPCGNLGLKKTFEREDLYDDILVDRY